MKVCSHEYCQLHCTVQVVAKKMNRGTQLFDHYIALWFWLSHYKCFLEASLSISEMEITVVHQHIVW